MTAPLIVRLRHLPGTPYRTGRGWAVRCTCKWVTPGTAWSPELASNEHTVLHLANVAGAR